MMLAKSCGPRLKALDIGKCDITDQGKHIKHIINYYYK